MSTKNDHDLVKKDEEKTVLLDLTGMFKITRDRYKKFKDENEMGYHATESSIWHALHSK